MNLRQRIRHSLTWRRHRLRRRRLTLEHPLRYLFLEITRQCNLACVYCGSNCTAKPYEGELDAAQWIAAVEQIAADFDPRRIMVAVTGGEPLLKEGVLDLFQALRRLGFRYGMVSNGMVLDEAMARDLVRAGIGSISLSMDALPETNDKLRGRGSSANVERAVKALQGAGYTGKLEIISTITRPAIQDFERMRAYVASLKVPLWRMAPVMPIGRAGKHQELIPDAQDVRAMLEFLRASRKDGLRPSPEFSEEGFVGYRFEGHVRPYLCQCNAGITVGGVRHNGVIAACPELSSEFDQGDLAKERFKAVWDERYEVMRDRSWARKGPCADCAHWSTCLGGALHLYDSTEGPFLRCFYLMLKESEAPARGVTVRDDEWFTPPRDLDR